MSSDLFAAFAPQSVSDTSSSTLDADRIAASGSHPPPQSSQPFSFFDGLGSPVAGRGISQSQTGLNISKDSLAWSSLDTSRQKDVTEDADDWGDFEGAPDLQPTAATAAGPGPHGSGLTESTQPLAAPIVQKSFRNQDSSGRETSVLFDATELEAVDDDFGDFETPTILPHSTGSADARVKPLSSQASKPISTAILNTPPASFKPIPQPQPTEQETESWDEFAEWDENSPQAANNDTDHTTDAPVLTLPSMMPSSNSTSSDHEPPPTNIPPPGVLLGLFPLLFSGAQTQLFKPMAAQTYQMKNRILADDTTVGFLQGYLTIATVAARVIAGRKLRWKRDAHLAQGMRVGPASSRATSGMKLTGIDKSEMNKEEREVLDVVRAWKDQVGRLRSAVAAANAIKPGCLGPVPDIQEAMPVKLLSEADGGVPAPRQCALCGLKREERVAKVDTAVEDSFGEWWVEQTRMHRACKNFWEKNKDALRQR
ncbi:hypothetical protein BU16DRAFT_553581 [Lophium mytilinum]|uniref:Serine/threonine-protein kinase ppk6 n=1 Tax=Lophium mytilinum TaxID=390894 RepID=A0A6A6Q9S1_9PEZI|nr:hypothetical protein BU16DRAFT_553581 [Lophium mytilinum]